MSTGPEGKKKARWWRYPVALVVFVLVADLSPLIIGPINTLLDYLSPALYRSGYAWTCVLTYVSAGALAIYLASQIVMVDGHEKKGFGFIGVMSALWAAWMAYYSISGFVDGYIIFEVACGMWVETLIMTATAVVCICMAASKDKPNGDDTK